jgi:hypothetical protein
MPTPTWPTFDVAEIAEEASERAGIEFRSGYALRTSRRALELLSIEWANRGLNLWTIDGPITVNLQPTVAQYSLPDDTIDLVDHIVRQPGAQTGMPNIDYPLDRWSFSDYSIIPNKAAAGRPTLINVRRAIRPYFVLWQVPPVGSTYQVLYWRLRRLKTLGLGGAGTPDIPWRFIPAMIAGLAFYLCLKSKDANALQRLQMLKAEYQEQFDLAADEDRERSSVRWVPGGNYEVI